MSLGARIDALLERLVRNQYGPPFNTRGTKPTDGAPWASNIGVDDAGVPDGWQMSWWPWARGATAGHPVDFATPYLNPYFQLHEDHNRARDATGAYVNESRANAEVGRCRLSALVAGRWQPIPLTPRPGGGAYSVNPFEFVAGMSSVYDSAADVMSAPMARFPEIRAQWHSTVCWHGWHGDFGAPEALFRPVLPPGATELFVAWDARLVATDAAADLTRAHYVMTVAADMFATGKQNTGTHATGASRSMVLGPDWRTVSYTTASEQLLRDTFPSLVLQPSWNP